MRRNHLDIANEIITYFIKIYSHKMNTKPIVNRGKLKFSIAEVLQDWNQKEIRSFIDYYVRTESQPDLVDFCRRYDEIIQNKLLDERDSEDRKQLMNETKASVLRFRELYKRD